jgi:hypothetical protein
MPRWKMVGFVGASAAGIGLAAAVLHARQTAFPRGETAGSPALYLRSGPVATRLALTFDALAADVYWIRAIQHFGRDAQRLRYIYRHRLGQFDASRDFVLLEPLLDLTTTLDPHFNIAYRFGAIFLSVEPPKGPSRPDLALKLLEKGLASNPSRWQYAFDAGFIHYWYTHDLDAAARAFDRAAAMSGAPNWLQPLAAVARAQAGDRTTARAMLRQLRESEAEYIRQAADRGLAQMDALDLIDRVNQIVEAYARLHAGAYPSRWEDLQRERLIGSIPADGTGAPLVYDPATHAVTLSPESPLMPLPVTPPRAPKGSE